MFPPMCTVSIIIVSGSEKLLGQNRIQINFECILGKSAGKPSCCHLDQQLCCVPKTQTSKPKVRPDESDRKREDGLCVSVRDIVCMCVCVMVKGLKKEEVKDSEYIPTGMRLTDNPK